MLKYLRIAVTALSLTACVLLIALWVRSYWWLDAANLPYSNTKSVYLVSLQGGFGGAIKPFRFDQVTVDHSRLERPIIVTDDFGQIAGSTWIQLLRVPSGGFTEVRFPYWIPALLTALLALAPWIRQSSRFSLRTLLIATTLVAVGLGVIVLSR